MKPLVILICVVLCVALLCIPSDARSQTKAKIALSTSVDGAECAIVDAAGITEVHVVVLDVEGFDGIQFAAPKPDCWTGATYLDEEMHGLLSIGNTQDTEFGLSVIWGACGDGGLTGTVHVATIRYQTTGQAPPCCDYQILKVKWDNYPDIPGPIIVLCDPLRIAGVTVDAVINPNPNCPCAAPTPVTPSTWSAIKAMYLD
jgi:hypothetical protein